MPRYRPEPENPQNDLASDIAVLLVNLGTPAEPTERALRPYLKQFLSDPRVIETPAPLWKPMLGFILATRPKKSAHKYSAIWQKEGSPLKIHTECQAKMLSGYLHKAGTHNIKTSWAMRYGEPSIASELDRLKAQGCKRILIVPLYPQYAASTTASVIDDVARYLLECRNIPEVRYVRNFPDHPEYIVALAKKVRRHWDLNGRGQKLIISFHGMPQKMAQLGDPYHQECQTSARLLAEALNLTPEQWQLTFQSRFGKAKWLKPYTQPTLEALAKQGVSHVDIICPGFVSDCLETLEEIAITCRDAYLSKGGKTFNYIPCLNDDPAWIVALASIVQKQLGGWL